MNHAGEWLNTHIQRLAYKLEHDMFICRELRARLKEELSTLLDQRDKYNEFKKHLAKEEQTTLKDPAWYGIYSPSVEPNKKAK